MDDPGDGTYSRAAGIEDLSRICGALNRQRARYVLIGGFAVIAHGGGRATKDIDLLVDDEPDNIERVKAALGVLADNAAAEVKAQDVRDYTVVRVADEVVVDLLGRACGLAYQDVIADAETVELDGVEIPIASKAMLIRTKDTARPIDRSDREFLQRRIAEEGE